MRAWLLWNGQKGGEEGVGWADVYRAGAALSGRTQRVQFVLPVLVTTAEADYSQTHSHVTAAILSSVVRGACQRRSMQDVRVWVCWASAAQRGAHAARYNTSTETYRTKAEGIARSQNWPASAESL